MSADYTPTTSTLRQSWVSINLGHIESGPGFDRWLAQHEADLRGRIATEIEDLAKSSPYAGQFNEAVFSAADIARGKAQT